MHNNTLKPVVMIASAINRFLNNTHVCDDNSIVSTDCLCDSVSFFIEKTNLVRTRQCLVYTFSTIRERISTRAITSRAICKVAMQTIFGKQAIRIIFSFNSATNYKTQRG